MSAAENPKVNRHLKDKAMDHIDHALGRPVWPHRGSYRNHFAIDACSDIAASFDASPHWRKGNSNGDMAFYYVTDAGRQALSDYLDSLDIGERYRAYVVTFEGQSWTTAAKSRAHARYVEWLKVSDCNFELAFGDFIKRSTVRLAS